LAKSWLWLRSQQPKELQFSGSAANQKVWSGWCDMLHRFADKTTMEISQFLRFEDATVRKNIGSVVVVPEK
jgi:hypothetical protein